MTPDAEPIDPVHPADPTDSADTTDPAGPAAPAGGDAGTDAGAAAPADAAALFTDVVLALFRAHGELIAWGDAFAADLGLTSARWQMLEAIVLAAAPGTAPQLAAGLGVSRQGAQKQLNLLEAEGLVARVANPVHQRSPQYRLTPQGERVHAEVSLRWARAAAGIAAQLGPVPLAATLQLLHRLPALLRQAAGGPLAAGPILPAPPRSPSEP